MSYFVVFCLCGSFFWPRTTVSALVPFICWIPHPAAAGFGTPAKILKSTTGPCMHVVGLCWVGCRLNSKTGLCIEIVMQLVCPARFVISYLGSLTVASTAEEAVQGTIVVTLHRYTSAQSIFSIECLNIIRRSLVVVLLAVCRLHR